RRHTSSKRDWSSDVCSSDLTPYTGHQSAPHGTTVADIILRIAPRVKLYSADVFGPAGTCEVETVIAAIRHAIDVWKVKVLNLSRSEERRVGKERSRKRELSE